MTAQHLADALNAVPPPAPLSVPVGLTVSDDGVALNCIAATDALGLDT